MAKPSRDQRRKAKDRKRDKRSKDRLNARNKAKAKKPNKLKSLLGGIKSRVTSALGRLRRPRSRPQAMTDGTFLYGPTDATGSSWVRRFGYLYVDSQVGMGLAVEFLDGAQVLYINTDPEDYDAMNAANSRGGWIWESEFYWREYVYVSF